MHIALAQINTTVGALRSNAQRAGAAFAEARAAGADLVVFPELTLPGYPPGDLLEAQGFAQACRAELDVLARATSQGGAMLVGTVEPTTGSTGKGLHNSAALLADGRVQALAHKSLLPTYDVFDEARYFDPAPADRVVPIEWGGLRLGVTLCEDVWNDADFWDRCLYDFDPAEHLAAQGVDVFLNLSASPFHVGKPHLRRDMLSRLAQDSGVPVLHCNLVGGNDELIFDGGSFVALPDGGFAGGEVRFAEDLALFDLDALVPGPVPEPCCDEADVAEALTLGVRDYFATCGFQRAVVGRYGGIDSAVTAAIAVRTLGADAVTGITMPSRYSSGGSVDDSEVLAEHLGVACHAVPIEEIHRAYHGTLGPLWAAAGLEPETRGLTDQNIQARIRGAILMAWSNRTGALVLSTGNKSELAVGYCTLYGDMAGGMAVISDLPKTLVYRVARWLNREREVVPEATITKPPSAELAPDQLDSDSLPDYDTLDRVLHAYLEERRSYEQIVEQEGVEPKVVEWVLRAVDRNGYKRRQAAPGLRISPKAFGSGRRFPVAARFEHHGFRK